MAKRTRQTGADLMDFAARQEGAAEGAAELAELRAALENARAALLRAQALLLRYSGDDGIALAVRAAGLSVESYATGEQVRRAAGAGPLTAEAPAASAQGATLGFAEAAEVKVGDKVMSGGAPRRVLAVESLGAHAPYFLLEGAEEDGFATIARERLDARAGASWRSWMTCGARTLIG